MEVQRRHGERRHPRSSHLSQHNRSMANTQTLTIALLSFRAPRFYMYALSRASMDTCAYPCDSCSAIDTRTIKIALDVVYNGSDVERSLHHDGAVLVRSVRSWAVSDAGLRSGGSLAIGFVAGRVAAVCQMAELVAARDAPIVGIAAMQHSLSRRTVAPVERLLPLRPVCWRLL